MDFKVMTFNLKIDIPEAKNNSWSERKDKVAKLINKYIPDMIGTQEGKIYMLEQLEQRIKNYSWIGRGRRGGEEGEYWLSENPGTAGSKSWDSSLPRICTWGEFHLKESDNNFLFYNTHLDHVGENARIKGIELIHEKIKNKRKIKKIPVFLTGDMNAGPETEVIKYINNSKDKYLYLNNSYEKLVNKKGATFHDFTGKIKGVPIDYIFFSSELECNKTIIIRDTYGSGNNYPSDHYPVLSHFEIK
ncbi:MAG: endonuclease/exonuclease/phosphatase family protein [Bacillota bacterium]